MKSDNGDARLDELDFTEWRDVARALRPDLSDEDLERMWGDFQAEKAKRALQ